MTEVLICVSKRHGSVIVRKVSELEKVDAVCQGFKGRSQKTVRYYPQHFYWRLLVRRAMVLKFPIKVRPFKMPGRIQRLALSSRPHINLKKLG